MCGHHFQCSQVSRDAISVGGTAWLVSKSFTLNEVMVAAVMFTGNTPRKTPQTTLCRCLLPARRFGDTPSIQ